MRIIIDPKKIEKKSFAIIEKFLSDFKFRGFEKDIARRIIHATADLNYARDISFSKTAVRAGITAVKEGRNIITDVTMVKAGVNAKLVNRFGGKIICFLNDKKVIKQSYELKVTRAVLALRKAAKFIDGAIVAIGNAPTALFELCDLVKKGKVKPALIVGMPVGFVGAVESKKELRSLKVPYITNKSKKGGSSVAVSAVNALLKLAEKEVGG